MIDLSLPTPKQIFDKFSEGLPRSGIKKFKEREPWTKYATEFFRNWGEELGFRVCCKKLYGGTGEYDKLDVVWKKTNDQSFLDLAVEHENDIQDVLESELQKLMRFKAHAKVLITYTTSFENVKSFFNDVRNMIRKESKTGFPNEQYLVMIGFPPENREPHEPFIQFLGHVSDSKATILDNFRSLAICTCKSN
jgi:hypothetical protein